MRKLDLAWGKAVGTESRRDWRDRLDSGFFSSYMNVIRVVTGINEYEVWGEGLELGNEGYSGETINPILPNATNVGLDYPGYDGKTLPFPNDHFHYVYASHVLEHIPDYKQAIREWYRVCKVRGHIIITVPHRDLYEKKVSPPSNWNEDHQRFYRTSDIVREIEESLEVNSFRVRYLMDEDFNFDYEKGPAVHSDGSYQLTLVIQKIKRPTWDVK